MNHFIPSKTGLELFQLEALTIIRLRDSIIEKLENTPGLSKNERLFWIERLKVLNELAESDNAFLQLAEQLKKQAQLN